MVFSNSELSQRRRTLRRQLSVEKLHDRMLLAADLGPALLSDSPNGDGTTASAEFSMDVNNDGLVDRRDMHEVTNYLNLSSKSRQLVPDPSRLDLTQDGVVSAIDALLIVNHIQNQTPGGGDVSPSTDTSPADTSSADLDINSDGSVNIVDIVLVTSFLNKHEPDSPVAGQAQYDTSGDGLVTPLDVLLLVNHVNALRQARVAQSEPAQSDSGDDDDLSVPVVSASAAETPPSSTVAG